jgi:hypothetical protein
VHRTLPVASREIEFFGRVTAVGRQALRAALVASLLTPLLLPSPACATSYVRMTDADLADQAPVIAEVVVQGLHSGVSPVVAAPRPIPSTYHEVEVERVLKGSLPSDRAIVRIPGGVGLDGVGFEVFGAPELIPGDRLLVFLTPRKDGTWDLLHLLLGVFRAVDEGIGTFAVRDLSEAHEVRMPGRVLPPEAPGTVRDFDRFASWLADRALGIDRPADYRVELPKGGLRRTQGRFVLFRDSGNCGDGQRLPIRWFKFEDGASASWQANISGQPGMEGGGLVELQNAMAMWRDDPDSNIRLSFQGTTSAQDNSGSGDGLIVFDDPRSEIGGSFDCKTGGVLAVGGPSFLCQPRSFNGASYRQALKGRIITQDGAGCYYGTADGKNGEEVFAHELGHTLGLAHSSTPGALMRASAYGDGRGASLGDDDRQAIAVLYGDGGGTGDHPGPQPPKAPSDLRAEARSDERIRLTWTDNSFDEDRFEVEGRSGSGEFRTLGAVGAGATAGNVVGLEPDTTYTFQVRACGDAGCSQPSNPATARTARAGEPPGPSLEERCSPDPSVLCLADNRFAVEVDWINPRDPTDHGDGTPIPDSDDSGFFWFFDPGNLELVVKILDGRPLNDHFWFFYGALSNVEYEIRVTDTETQEVRTYHNTAGNLCGRGDVEAFLDTGSASTTEPTVDPTEPGSTSGDPSAADALDEGALDEAEVLEAANATTCPDDPRALCLLDERFEVSVDWVNPRAAGDAGHGTPVPRSDSTGTFWFFDPDNVELVVKVLDGRVVNGKFWVFYGGLSDVEYTLRVRDRVENTTRFYHNPAGEICGLGDVTAF